VLYRYDVADFVFDDLGDSELRHDVTTRTVIVPRERFVTTPRDRFTRESEKASRVPRRVRLDLTERPTSYEAAISQVHDRQFHIGTPRPGVSGTQASLTIKHYTQVEHDPHQPHDPHHGRLR